MSETVQKIINLNPSSHLANSLKAAGDVLRLEILTILARDSFGVLELSHIFDVKQSGMSHHLKVLTNAQLVSTRREGNTIFYRRSDAELNPAEHALRTAIFEASDSLILNEHVQRNRQDIYQQRAQASKAFFISHADAFKKQQELIAAFDMYGSEVARMLGKIPATRRGTALEVGPGAGEFLPELSERFENVLALDTSLEMLQHSRVLCQNQALDNVEFIHNDTRFISSFTRVLDCVVINMVLHHTPSPAQIFKDVSSALRIGGKLIVCELGSHDQDWVKDSCGDLWLGFDNQELNGWANACNLTESNSRYFALRNGFNIQIHQYTKV